MSKSVPEVKEKCPYCNKSGWYWQLLFPNPLCWMFEFQLPNWVWNNYLFARIVYTLHDWTCADCLSARFGDGF